MTQRCSIVIPIRDRVGLTRRCLDAIVADPPAVEFGVMLVDDGSTTSAEDELQAYSAQVQFMVRGSSDGFATACNDGAAATVGEYVVFLNNDTIVQPGWLDALVRYADDNPAAGAVGCRLLFPDHTIQHAGVVICQDGLPRHLYAGFPAGHPAVMRSRRFHAVTAASMLVRRDAFERAGGFDPAFHNGLEDVDLCLRLEELGYEVHYCHDSVVYHLESASRGRRVKETAANVRLFRDRWTGRVRPDELEFYNRDGLLTVGYESTYPVGLTVAPELATVRQRAGEADLLLATFARRLGDLLHEVARLTATVAEGGREPSVLAARGSSPIGSPVVFPETYHAALRTILRRAEDVEIQIHGLQAAIAEAVPAAVHAPEAHLEASPVLAYRRLVREIRSAARSSIPEGATVLVVSNGDEELVRLDGRTGRHFPQDETGAYLGYHPADSDAAIQHLEQLRAEGADYLLLPSTAAWWLAHYEAFAQHLDEKYLLLARDDASVIFALGDQGGTNGAVASAEAVDA